MADDDIRRRLEAILTDHIPDGDLTPSGELKAILAMPPAVREAVTARLEAIDRFQKDPGTARADAEAHRLGMKRRNFYNLVARLRMQGPSRALSPSKAGYRREPSIDAEVGNVTDNSITATLSEDPEASASKVIAAVKRDCELEGLKAPSDRTIRLRLGALRSNPSLGLHLGDEVLGRVIFIDQSAAAFALQDQSGETLGLVTLVVDAGTRLILAIGVGSSGVPESGLRLALDDWEKRRSQLPYDLFECRQWPEYVHWVVPDRLADEVRNWSRTAALSELATFATTQGARRHGSRLLRSIGASLGWLRFLPRYTGEMAVPEAMSEKLPRLDQHSAQEAAALLADSWNDVIALKKAGECLAEDAAGVAQRDSSGAGEPYGLTWIFDSLRVALEHADAWEALRARKDH